LKACHEYPSGKDTAQKVHCSSLVITGAEDRMTPASKGRELAGLIPECNLEVLHHCGHMMMLEDSKACLDALKQNI